MYNKTFSVESYNTRSVQFIFYFMRPKKYCYWTNPIKFGWMHFFHYGKNIEYKLHEIELKEFKKSIKSQMPTYLLSCQPRVTVVSCFVYKVIMDLSSIDHLCINRIPRDRINTQVIYQLALTSSSGVYKLNVNKILRQCHSWLARQYFLWYWNLCGIFFAQLLKLSIVTIIWSFH